MKVTIKGPGTNPREYQGKNFVEQQAALDTGADFPLVFRLNVEQGKEYAPGQYTLDPRSFVTDQHGNLGVKRPKLLALGK